MRSTEIVRRLVAGVLAAGVGLGGLTGCGGDDAREPVPIEDVREDAADLAETDVIVTGRVSDVITERSFVLAPTTGADEPGLLVIRGRGLELVDGGAVVVTGELRLGFEPESVEDELVFDENEVLFRRFQDEPFIIADLVEPVP